MSAATSATALIPSRTPRRYVPVVLCASGQSYRANYGKLGNCSLV